MLNYITCFNGYVSREKREKLNGHLGCAIWLTGLSASGKSSIAQLLEKELHEGGHSTYVLDGDNIRHGLCSDLGFSNEARTENIRRMAELTKLFVDAGMIVISAFISPIQKDRDYARSLIEPGRFIEVFVDCPLEICEQRDPKGIYKKARQGLIKDFTGIDSPYEKPSNPEFHLKTEKISIDECVQSIVEHLKENNLLVCEKERT